MGVGGVTPSQRGVSQISSVDSSNPLTNDQRAGLLAQTVLQSNPENGTSEGFASRLVRCLSFTGFVQKMKSSMQSLINRIASAVAFLFSSRQTSTVPPEAVAELVNEPLKWEDSLQVVELLNEPITQEQINQIVETANQRAREIGRPPEFNQTFEVTDGKIVLDKAAKTINKILNNMSEKFIRLTGKQLEDPSIQEIRSHLEEKCHQFFINTPKGGRLGINPETFTDLMRAPVVIASSGVAEFTLAPDAAYRQGDESLPIAARHLGSLHHLIDQHLGRFEGMGKNARDNLAQKVINLLIPQSYMGDAAGLATLALDARLKGNGLVSPHSGSGEKSLIVRTLDFDSASKTITIRMEEPMVAVGGDGNVLCSSSIVQEIKISSDGSITREAFLRPFEISSSPTSLSDFLNNKLQEMETERPPAPILSALPDPVRFGFNTEPLKFS